MNPFCIFRHHALNHLTDAVLFCDEQSITYQEALSSIIRVASALQAAGVMPGDRVAIHIGNTEEIFMAMFACTAIGAIIVPVNLRQNPVDAADIIARAAASVYLGDLDRYHAMSEQWQTLSCLRLRCIVGLPGNEENETLRSWHHLAAADFTVFEPADEDIATIFFTAGTTGVPKGLVWTYSTLAINITRLVHLYHIREKISKIPSRRILYSTYDISVPWNILMCLSGPSHGCAVRMTQIITPENTLQLIATHAVNWISGAPSSYRELLAAAPHFKGKPLNSSNVTFIVGGDATNPILVKQIRDVFNCGMANSYGQSELGPVICHADIPAHGYPALGWPMEGVETKLEKLADGGNLLFIKSASRAVGLWQKGKVIKFPGDGWVNTEDIVETDDNGCFFFLGRTQERIKVDGYSVTPAEIEKEIRSISCVTDATVFGVTNVESGSRPIALVQLFEKTIGSEELILKHLHERLSSYKIPHEIILVSEIPVLHSAKISRRKLAAAYEKHGRNAFSSVLQ